MAINQKRYVRINSTVAGAQSVAQQKLVGRVFTTNPRVPVGEILEVRLGGAGDYFGNGSDEAVFEGQYFGYISPAPASQAPTLQFAAYAPSGRVANVFGGKVTEFVDAIKTVPVNLVTTFKGETKVTTADISSSPSYDDIATKINFEMNLNGSGLTFGYDSVTQSFTISGDAIENSSIKLELNESAFILGFRAQDVIFSDGVESQSPLDAFKAAEVVSDSFGSATFLLHIEEYMSVCTYVGAQNMKYQFYVGTSHANGIEIATDILPVPSCAAILNGTEGEFKQSLPMAIMAATDYDRDNAAISYMYRQSPLTPDVFDDILADKYDKVRLNYYGQTASAGQKIAFFQKGFLGGGATAAVDMGVHANEQWLKAFLTSRFFAMLLGIGRVPANRDGESMILAQVSEAATKAIMNGTILKGKTLTALQQVAVTQASNDYNAWQQVQNEGYWAKAFIVVETDQSGAEVYVAKYTLIYAKGDAVRVVEGSHNLV